MHCGSPLRRRPSRPVFGDVEIEALFITVWQLDFHHVVAPAVERSRAAGVSFESAESTEDPFVLEIDAAIRRVGGNGDRCIRRLAGDVGQGRGGGLPPWRRGGGPSPGQPREPEKGWRSFTNT